VIHRLEQAGLIKRNPHPNHRRKRPASLTAKGKKVVVACESAVAGFETRMLRGFSRTEQNRFRAMIKTAVRNLGGGFQEAGHAEEGAADQPPATRRSQSRRAA
jgi:DNA-binding MarR family transcriptional regulator